MGSGFSSSIRRYLIFKLKFSFKLFLGDIKLALCLSFPILECKPLYYLNSPMSPQARGKATDAYAPELDVVIDPPRLANMSAKKNEVV